MVEFRSIKGTHDILPNEIKKWQGQVHIINYTKDKSSTGILEKLI